MQKIDQLIQIGLGVAQFIGLVGTLFFVLLWIRPVREGLDALYEAIKNKFEKS